MSISWHDLPGLQRLVNKVLDIILGPVVTILFLEVEDEVEALLVREAVQWTSQPIHTC